MTRVSAGHTAAVPTAALPVAATPAGRTRLNVLVLEDDADDAAILMRHLTRLRRYECSVMLCSSLEGARDLLSRATFDLCIFDYWLGGEESLSILADGEAERRQPIILLSGMDMIELEDRAFDSGVVSCIAKADVSARLLESTVHAAIRRHAGREAAERERRELERSIEQHSRTIGTLAHEVGNLVSSARAAGELSRMGVDVGENAGMIGLIEGQMKHLHDTTAAILNLAGLAHAAGRGTVDLAMDDLAGRLERLATPIVSQRGQMLAVDSGPPASARVADATLLVQLVMNLVSNASKYSGTGSTIGVRLRARDGVSIEVRDHGRGMDADELVRLRERFERACAVRGEVPGTGLGLSIVEEFVAHLGGTLSIASTPGRGTTVSVTIPPAGAALPAAQEPLVERPAHGEAASSASCVIQATAAPNAASAAQA